MRRVTLTLRAGPAGTGVHFIRCRPGPGRRTCRWPRIAAGATKWARAAVTVPAGASVGTRVKLKVTAASSGLTVRARARFPVTSRSSAASPAAVSFSPVGVPGLTRPFLPAGVSGAEPGSGTGLLFPVVTPQRGGRRTGPGTTAVARNVESGLLDSRMAVTQAAGLAALAAAVALAVAGHRIRRLRAALATTAGLAMRASAQLRHPRATAAAGCGRLWRAVAKGARLLLPRRRV
jgi:hypothetical protein